MKVLLNPWLNLKNDVEEVAGVLFRTLIDEEILRDTDTSECAQVYVYLATRMADNAENKSVSEVVEISMTETEESKLKALVEHVSTELRFNDYEFEI